MTTCPICKSELKSITKKHLDSKGHKDALTKAGIAPAHDPTLEVIKKHATPKKSKGSQTKPRLIPNKFNLIPNNVNERLNNLESIVGSLQKQQNEIIYKLENLYKKFDVKVSKGVERQLKEEDVFQVIKICVQNNVSRWIKIDDIISVLKLNQEQDRRALNKLLVKMFNNNLIDLAEGGDPKYPLIYQNKKFGMIAPQ